MVVKFQDLEIEHTAKYNEMKNKGKSLSSITFVVNEHLAGGWHTYQIQLNLTCLTRLVFLLFKKQSVTGQVSDNWWSSNVGPFSSTYADLGNENTLILN